MKQPSRSTVLVAALGVLLQAGLASSSLAQAPGTPPAAPSLISYSGDGLRIDVFTINDDETITGQIQRDGKVFPFTAKSQYVGNAESIVGSFTAGGQAFPFEAKQSEDESLLTFITGNKTYRLKVVLPNGPLNDKPPAPPAVANPLSQDPGGPVGPGPGAGAPSPTAPGPFAPSPPVAPGPGAPVAPPPPPAPIQPIPAQPAPVPPPAAPAAPVSPSGQPVANPLQQLGAAKTPATRMMLKVAKFHDVNMGNVVSHTMLVPDGWKAEGRIEWSMGDSVYPQTIINVAAPDKSGISYYPTMNFSYTRMQQPGLMQPQGTPPPANFGEWLTSLFRQTSKTAQNVRLVKAERDAAAEAAAERMRQQMGVNLQGATSEIHNVTLAYESDGVTMREVIIANYTRFAPIVNQNIHGELWSVMIGLSMRAPENRFDQIRPTLVMMANSFKPEAKWWTQMQLTLMEITRVRHEARMEAIRKRAEFYDQMTAQQHQAFKEKMAAGDANQHNFLNMINETADYQNPNGSTVNLPMHYHHVFTNGDGAYLLTNNITDKPGELWQEVKPVSPK